MQGGWDDEQGRVEEERGRGSNVELEEEERVRSEGEGKVADWESGGDLWQAWALLGW